MSSITCSVSYYNSSYNHISTDICYLESINILMTSFNFQNIFKTLKHDNYHTSIKYDKYDYSFPKFIKKKIKIIIGSNRGI